MNNFRTEIDIQPHGFDIGYNNRGLCVGSCFAQNIAERLETSKFRVQVNPLGVMYNPLSIANTLRRLASGTEFTADDLVFGGELWCCFDTHGLFSALNPDEALERMNTAVRSGTKAFQEADYLIVTFGSAWIYELVGRDGVVANCHKFPQKMFTRRRLSVRQIVDTFEQLLQNELNGKRVLFTVSPIRHLKDGMHENTVSKATLALAVESLTQSHGERCAYFPSYEIMMDDLRDYRFWQGDMVHPSVVAIDYIWQHFTLFTMDRQTRNTCCEIEQIMQGVSHRPFNPDSLAHARFKSQMLERVRAVMAANPTIDMERELRYFSLQEQIKNE